MYRIESYDQIISSLIKRKILDSNFLYFNTTDEIIRFHSIRYNIQPFQIKFDNDDYIVLNNKLGEKFSTIGKIIGIMEFKNV